MVRTKLIAAALGPLLAAGAAQAQVVVSNNRTTPIVTSTASGSGPADVRLDEDGSIELRSGIAIRGDSDNEIDLDDGAYISMDEAADGTTAILLDGGRTGALIVGGQISITDDLDSVEDDDEDGDLDGPISTGRDRFGVRVTGPGVRRGDLRIEDTGSLYVEGSESAGLSLETDLDGEVSVLGSIQVVGADSYGTRLRGDVSGDVLLTGGSVTVTGENSVGLSLEGNVGGRLQFQSEISTNAYRYSSRPTSLADLEEEDREQIDLSDDTLYLQDLDADDLLQAGSALRIAGDVAGGVLLGTGPGYETGGEEGDADRDGIENGEEDDDGDGTINEDDDDRDGDGILDEDEGTASLTTYGGAPAMVIGSTGADIAIGAVGQGDQAFGLINQGSISSQGVYDGVENEALRIGTGAGRRVDIAGGLLNEGTIVSTANEASATTIVIDDGGSVPAIVNDGTLTASVTTEGTDTAAVLRIEAGAAVSSLTNTGSIMSVIYGEAGDAVAIRDLSGSLSRIENSGTLYGDIVSTDGLTDTDDDNDEADDEIETGREIALDLSANTRGVTLIQTGASDQRHTDTDGDDLWDDEDPDDDDDGVLDGEDDDDNDDDNDGVYDYDEPVIYGEILLGSGDDLVDIRDGTVSGDIAFGTGADRLSVTGGATVTGALGDTDGRLDVMVENATLDARQTSSTAVSSLTVAAGGELILSVDPQAHTSGGFTVSGSARFDDGSSLGVRLSSLVTEAQRFDLVTATDLDYGNVLSGLGEDTAPYLVVATFAATAGTVHVDLRQRTTAEMGLSAVESSAYYAFYDALARDDEVQDAFLAPEAREDFINLYEQTLPDHSGGTLMALASGVDAVTRALVGRNHTATPGEVSAWVQEINFYADKDRTETYGFRSEGFGLAGGVERSTARGAVGLSLAFTSSDLEDPESEAEEVLSASLVELGLYWRAQGRSWTTWARAAAGYARFESTRTLVDETIYLSNAADWDGFTLAMAAGASWERDFGRLNIRPEVRAEVFALSETSRTEDGGGDSFDLAIEGRDGLLASAVAALNIGYGFGETGWLRPEMRLGWKQTLASDIDDTIARYVSGGQSFALAGDGVSGGGPLMGLGLTIGNSMAMLSIAGDAELLEDYVRYSLLLRASFRF